MKYQKNITSSDERIMIRNNNAVQTTNTATQSYFAGIDVGSTTVKVVILNQHKVLKFNAYRRHNTKINQTLTEVLEQAKQRLGNINISVCITGSAGMGISEKTGTLFIQEVVASTEVIRKMYPEVKTLIDIGGEDSKMIFFNDNKIPDIRMNGNCAGGTGAFIDQMAVLLNFTLDEFDKAASKYKQLYPIASRCGVFAKTDVQNLISRKIPKEDIAASVFHAVTVQTINTLARGFDIVPKVMFSGGPFTFLSQLNETFKRNLNLDSSNILFAENPELLPALGAAISQSDDCKQISLSDFQLSLEQSLQNVQQINYRLNPLFSDSLNFETWKSNKSNSTIPKKELTDYTGKKLFLGIDSGSTTTKIAVTGENDELLFHYYANNSGDSINALRIGLLSLKNQLDKTQKQFEISHTTVTGYGEDLIKAAFGIDVGVVETIAHYTAARFFEPRATFIMDIGGQDMKAIFIENGIINRIELNESCSSGCGSFIETFGKSLGYQVADFARIACNSEAPCDLGTRCTVFMNSKVKQALREHATTEDIAAGLAYSVIKNALYKVLKLKDISELGDYIVVQGGTFRNPSIQRAMEQLTGKQIICPDIPELMGAYGSALIARNEYLRKKREDHKFNGTSPSTTFIGVQKLEQINNIQSKQVFCKGCENNCAVTRFNFDNQNIYFSGNKCEKIFTNKGANQTKGINLVRYKHNLLFERNCKAQQNSSTKPSTIGIPRVLNMYENFPFWNTLFTETGFNVVLSDPSTMQLYEKGLGTVMSDSICFPAKLVHGHIIDLINKKVDRIFYPMVVYEASEFEDAENSFNCPIVSSYPDVIKSSVNPSEKYHIPFDQPPIAMNNNKLLKRACYSYFNKLGVNKRLFLKAFDKALTEQLLFKQNISKKATEIIEKANAEKRQLVVLAGRPYHIDPLINHKTPEILEELGVDIITEDAVPNTNKLGKLKIITQWSYPNRIYNAVQWVAEQDENVQLIQLNSFGCGPDAIAVDESVEILKAYGKNHTLIRIDEITSVGSVRLRLRSMIESLKLRNNTPLSEQRLRISTAHFEMKDKQRTILAPQFSKIYSPFLPTLFAISGYKLINLPHPNKSSVQAGLRYSNNEICYPATIIIGDVIKALQSGNYNRDEIAIGITQTGGQCRASTYLSLIKKGMVDAGFADVPVVSVATAGITINPQPGFRLDWKKLMLPTFISILFADSLSKMYYSTVVRERTKGESKKLLFKYIEQVQPLVAETNVNAIFELLKKAIEEFNSVPIINGEYPKIGIVGEIFVKYNSFGHHYIVDWLIEQGIEVVVPPIMDFFIQEFVNTEVNMKANLTLKNSIKSIFLFFLERRANKYLSKVEKLNSKFRFYSPFHKIRDISKKAANILNLVNQFGEGWLIPAEIASFADEGINNVVSLQPFGCIANQVISKGIEKRVKDLYPNTNLLFLDFDDGTSEVNILNRLHFMVRNVSEIVSYSER